MIDDTILVVDADHETEEKIVSTLEAEGYLVFTASGSDVSKGMAEKISPALIYLKPAGNSVEGFGACKAIHAMEKYRNVPIILLASLRGTLDSRYTTFYGVVDYLKMPLSSGELIEMTEKILGSRSRDMEESVEENIGSMEEASVLSEKGPAALNLNETPEVETGAEEGAPDTQWSAADDRELADMSEVGRPDEDYSYGDPEEDLKGGLFERDRRIRRKQYSFLKPFLVVTATIAVVAAGFLIYKFFISTPEVKVPVAATSPNAVQQQEPPASESSQAEVKEMPQEASAQNSTTAPVQKTAPVPAPVTATKPVAKTVYSVQLGAFRSESGAEGLVKDYKGKGYEAFTRRGTTKDNASVYRVLIGEFENRKEALKLAARIETIEKIKTTIYSQGTR